MECLNVCRRTEVSCSRNSFNIVCPLHAVIDTIVIAVLAWLLVVHCMLHILHTGRRRLLGGALDKLHHGSDDAVKFAEEFVGAKSYLLRLSGRADVNVAHAGHAIFISAVCLSTPILLMVLNHVFGVQPAGWLSVLFLPAPTCMLGWYIYDWFRWSAGGRQFDTIRGLTVPVWKHVFLASVILAGLLMAAWLIPQGMIGQKIQSVGMASPDADIGIFATISGLIAIIAGGVVLRLLYVDKEYRERISTMDKTRVGAGRGSQVPRWHGGLLVGDSAFNMQPTPSQPDTHKELSNVSGKREANGRGVLVDGVCMTAICIVGFATELGS